MEHLRTASHSVEDELRSATAARDAARAERDVLKLAVDTDKAAAAAAIAKSEELQRASGRRAGVDRCSVARRRSRGDAAAARMFRGDECRGDAAAATWIFRGGASRRRRGRDVNIPRGRVAAAAPRRGNSSRVGSSPTSNVAEVSTGYARSTLQRILKGLPRLS